MKRVLIVGATAVVLGYFIGVQDTRFEYSASAAENTVNRDITVVPEAAVQPSGPPRAGPEVCYDDRGNTHFVRSDEPCEPGEKRTKLVPELLDPNAEDPQAKLEKKIADLTARLAKLEGDKAKEQKAADDGKAADDEKGDGAPSKGTHATDVHVVRAPFEVVGADGKVILRVADTVSATDGQGARVTIGGGPKGNYALRVYADGGSFVSGVGQGANGSGLVVVSDRNGVVSSMSAKDRAVSVFDGSFAVASMVAAEKGGEISIFNGQIPIAHMSRSSAGDGGNITVSLNSGFGVFSAGAAQDGAGEACVNRITQAGTKRPACIGLALPSAGMGK